MLAWLLVMTLGLGSSAIAPLPTGLSAQASNPGTMGWMEGFPP